MPFSMTQNPLSCCRTVPKQGFEHKELTWLWKTLGNILDPDHPFVAFCVISVAYLQGPEIVQNSFHGYCWHCEFDFDSIYFLFYFEG